MEYLVRFAQVLETFRQPEIESLAALAGIQMEIISYDPTSPFCVVKLQSEQDARALISRSILARDIFELWGQGATYEELHADIRRRTQHLWSTYREVPFRFTVDSMYLRRSMQSKHEIMQQFTYLDFKGPIRMKNPDEDFWVFEEFHPPKLGVSPEDASVSPPPTADPEPKCLHFGRMIGTSSREVVRKYNLKKRKYISTTTMDAELTLITANMAHAAPGKVMFDPFVGTGSFSVAVAHFGALALGSDIDGRSFRGKDQKKGEPMGIIQNFQQYGIESKFLDTFTSDLTNTPLINRQFLDGIVCDPPYGVREGLQVLGLREGRRPAEPIDGIPVHLRPGYVAPKKPYGFEAMLNDILAFAARTLVTNGRLSMWMPAINDEDTELMIPMHPNLEVLHVSIQPFNTWSRRLITYRRLPEGELSDISLARNRVDKQGTKADELNPFRQKYFLRANYNVNKYQPSSSS